MTRAYTAEEVDGAVERLQAPGALDHAAEIVTHAAPSLSGVLDQALTDGGWFGPAHEQQLFSVASAQEEDRMDALRTLVGEQTRLGMLVGVAVGFELARQLDSVDRQTQEEES